MELDFYTPVLIGVNFFAFRTDYNGRLHAVYFRLDAVEAATGTPRDDLADTGEAIVVVRRLGVFHVVVVAGTVMDVDDEEFPCIVIAAIDMAGQAK